MKKDDLILDDWQKDIIDYNGNVLLCTGRQVGKTLTMSRKACKYMLKHPNSQIVIVSLTEDQAKLIIVMILDYLQKHYKNLIATGNSRPTQSRVTLKNKATAIARPVGNTGDAVRGFTGDVLIIDEASRMPPLAFEAAKPVLLTTAGQIWICSTPAGKQGYFWEAYQNKNNRFRVWHKSSEEVVFNRVICDTWTEHKRAEAIKFLKAEQKDMSRLQYGQEYLGLFMEDLMRYFDDEWIDRVCRNKQEASHINRHKDYYLGVDIARMGGDETAFEVIKKINKDNLVQVYNETQKKWLTTRTEDRIKELDKLYNFQNIYIDAGSGSLGVGIFDHLLREEQTKRKVVAINNRKIVLDREGKQKQKLLKEDLYDNLRALGERGRIILLDDERVRLSLRSVQYEFIRREEGLTRMRIFGNYTHIAEGLIRAAWCSKEKDIKMFISSIKI